MTAGATAAVVAKVLAALQAVMPLATATLQSLVGAVAGIRSGFVLRTWNRERCGAGERLVFANVSPSLAHRPRP